MPRLTFLNPKPIVRTTRPKISSQDRGSGRRASSGGSEAISGKVRYTQTYSAEDVLSAASLMYINTTATRVSIEETIFDVFDPVSL